MSLVRSFRFKALVASVLLPLMSYATTDGSKPTYKPGEYVPKGALPSGYAAAGRVDPIGYWDVTFEGSFLYWQAKEKGLDFGYVVPSDPTNRVGTRLNKHFNYHPGFLLSLSTDVHHDGWECGIDYFYLHTTENTSSDSPSWATGIEAVWFEDPTEGGPAVSSVVAASAEWTFKYDMLDIWLDRPSYIGRTLIVTPLFGFRGGWIRQHFKPVYTISGTGPVSAHAKQISGLIGPRLGLDGKLLMGKGFCFKGGAALAMLYEDSKITFNRQNFTNTSLLSTNVKDHERFFIPNMDLSLGLGWGSYFHKDRWFFDASLNFDIQYYWGQNWMRHLKDANDERVDGQMGDLTLQGLTASAGFYF